MVKSQKTVKPAAKKTSDGKKGAEKAKKEVPSCEKCGIIISQDVRALNCDRCGGHAAWKCAACLDMSDEVYDALVAGTALKWFCDDCDHCILEGGRAAAAQLGSTDVGSKLDAIVGLLQQLVERTVSLEKKLEEKAERSDVSGLETRVKKLEDGGPPSDAGATTTKAFEEVLNRKKDEEEDISNRRNNIIIYRLKEEAKESKEERNQKDRGFVNSLGNIALEVEIRERDIIKMYRLGEKKDGVNRPLLVRFRTEAKKEEMMTNLNKLKSADECFRSIGVANDLSPKQREEIRRALEQARNADDDTASENQKYRVVGQGSNLRVIKVRRN
jgi:hypothetical protein